MTPAEWQYFPSWGIIWSAYLPIIFADTGLMYLQMSETLHYYFSYKKVKWQIFSGKSGRQLSGSHHHKSFLSASSGQPGSPIKHHLCGFFFLCSLDLRHRFQMKCDKTLISAIMSMDENSQKKDSFQHAAAKDPQECSAATTFRAGAEFFQKTCVWMAGNSGGRTFPAEEKNWALTFLLLKIRKKNQPGIAIYTKCLLCFFSISSWIKPLRFPVLRQITGNLSSLGMEHPCIHLVSSASPTAITTSCELYPVLQASLTFHTALDVDKR